MNSLTLLILGLLSILIEFFAPGAVFGVLGSISILASVVYFIMEGHSALESLLYITFVGALIAFLIKFALWRIRKTQPEQSFYADADQAGYVASAYDHTAVGKEGKVLSDLKPGGYIQIENKKHQAISLSGYLQQGTLVKVVGGQEESLLVVDVTQAPSQKKE